MAAAPFLITVSTPLMVVASPAAALLLLLTSTVVATAAKTLVAVRAIGGVTVLVSSSAGIAHSVGAATVAAMALQVARVAAVSTAHLRGLGRRQAAGLSARASVSGRPGTGTPNRGRGSRGFAVAKRLQVVSTRGTSARLGLAVETLRLRLEGGATSGKAVVGAAKAGGTEARLRASLASRTAAVVTQASAAIPAMPIYLALLFKVMKERGVHEGCIEQVDGLFRDSLYGSDPYLDEEGRLRADRKELDPAVQAAVAALWEQINTDTLRQLSDFDGYKREFLQLFGFEVDGVDYEADVNPDVAIANLA